MAHGGLGVGEAVRVGHNLQEDVHLVQDGLEGRIACIIVHDLVGGVEMQKSVQKVPELKLQRKVKKVKDQERMEAPSWRTRCRWPG